MSIDTQSLKSSELGKIVLFYTKCPRVDPAIKRMADQLVSTCALASLSLSLLPLVCDLIFDNPALRGPGVWCVLIFQLVG
jgi:hypothetical protein